MVVSFYWKETGYQGKIQGKKHQHLHFLYLLTSLMCFYSGRWHYEYLNWLLRILTICFYSLISVHIRVSYGSNKRFWQFVLLIKFYQQSYGHLILQSVILYVNLTDFSTCCEAGHRASCQLYSHGVTSYSSSWFICTNGALPNKTKRHLLK